MCKSILNIFILITLYLVCYAQEPQVRASMLVKHFRDESIVAILNFIKAAIDNIGTRRASYVAGEDVYRAFIPVAGQNVDIVLASYKVGAYEFPTCNLVPDGSLFSADEVKEAFMHLFNKLHSTALEGNFGTILCVYGYFSLKYYARGHQELMVLASNISYPVDTVKNLNQNFKDTDLLNCWIYGSVLETGNIKEIGTHLPNGNSLTSSNRLYRATLDKCNLIVDHILKQQSIWATNTEQHNIYCYLHLQPDGHLVIKSSDNNIIWKNKRYCNNCEINCVFIIEDNGILSIYYKYSNKIFWQNRIA